MSATDIRIDRASEADVPVILALIKALADYERLTGDVMADEARIRESLFGVRPAADRLLQTARREADGRVDRVPSHR